MTVFVTTVTFQQFLPIFSLKSNLRVLSTDIFNVKSIHNEILST